MEAKINEEINKAHKQSKKHNFSISNIFCPILPIFQQTAILLSPLYYTMKLHLALKMHWIVSGGNKVQDQPLGASLF